MPLEKLLHFCIFFRSPPRVTSSMGEVKNKVCCLLEEGSEEKSLLGTELCETFTRTEKNCSWGECRVAHAEKYLVRTTLLHGPFESLITMLF